MDKPEQGPGQGEPEVRTRRDRSAHDPGPDERDEREWVIAQIQESFQPRG